MWIPRVFSTGEAVNGNSDIMYIERIHRYWTYWTIQNHQLMCCIKYRFVTPHGSGEGERKKKNVNSSVVIQYWLSGLCLLYLTRFPHFFYMLVFPAPITTPELFYLVSHFALHYNKKNIRKWIKRIDGEWDNIVKAVVLVWRLISMFIQP